MSILDRFKLDGKIALVTGANRGLGRGVAEGLAEAGAHIVGVNRSMDDGGLAAFVTGLGQRYEHIALDLLEASTADIQGAVQQVVDTFGKLDILVNNAGIVRRGSVMGFSEDDWLAVIQVNLNAAFFLSQAAAAHMKAQGGGKIINIASMLSYQGGVKVPSYAAAKHGIAGLTKAMANELAEYRINVNAISPGYMATDLNVSLRDDTERNRAIVERIPAGDWGTAEDLQGAAVYLASAASDYVHGTLIAVDGGWLAR
jgi:2-deoxy-D-gluconate 3-dehydrogenase